MLEDLPNELIQEIVFKSDLRSRIRLSQTSKNFHEFLQKHILSMMYVAGAAQNTKIFIPCYPYAVSAAIGMEELYCVDHWKNLWRIHDQNVFKLIRRNVLNISAEDHSLLIDGDNTVWANGVNYFGEVGVGSRSFLFEYAPLNITAQQIDVYGFRSGLVDETGKIHLWGEDFLNEKLSIDIPTLHFPNISAKQISVGYNHLLIRDKEDELWVYGQNEFGQLGLGHKLEQSFPMCVSKIKVSYVAAGEWCSLIIDTNNRVWYCGMVGPQIGTSSTYSTTLTWTKLEFPEKVKCIDTHSGHSCLIDVENKVWVTGCNENGQLGLGDDHDRHSWTLVPNYRAITASVDEINTILIGSSLE